MSGQGTTKTCCALARNRTCDGVEVIMTARRHCVANDVVGIPGRATVLSTNALQIQDGSESSARTVLVKPFRMAPWRFQMLHFPMFP